MGLLQRYIFRAVAVACAGGVGLFVLVLMTSNALRDLTTRVPLEQLSPGLVLHIFGLLVPFAASLSLPLGMLIGILLVMGRLSADQELTAMRAAGLSLWQVASPLLIIALGGVALGVYVNGWQAPTTRAAYKQTLRDVLRQDPERIIQARTFIHDFDRLVLYVGDRQGAHLEQLWVWQLDDQRRVVRVLRADSAELSYDAERDSLLLEIRGGYVELRDPANPDNLSRVPPVLSIAATSFRLPLNQAFDEAVVERPLSQLTLPELWQRRSAAQARVETAPTPDDALLAQTEATQATYLASRGVALACSILALGMVGVPLGIQAARKETHANIGIALGLAMAYYLGMIMIDWTQARPELYPALLVWLPNLVFIGLGGWMLAKTSRW